MNPKITNRFKAIALAILFLALALLFAGCSLFDKPEKEITANEYIYAAFEEWYLWYDQLPNVDPNDYETQDELIDAIKVEQDRWSFAASYSDIKKLFEKAEYTGFGGGFILDADMQIKITHVYRDSPFGQLGVERGWIVNSVNGYDAGNLTAVNEALNSSGDVAFVFTDHQGVQHNATVKKIAISMNTVLHSSILEKEGHRVGYLVFDNFAEVSKVELTNAFESFIEDNITDLIVDFRYNGGGLVDVAYQLVGMIGGDKVAGQTISTTKHNDKKADNDVSEVSDYSGPKLSIDKVYFLTARGTASASELVINCLEPFMEVKLVGNNTHGKPVGMYILSVEDLDLAILPISFKNINAEGYGDYYNGLPADIFAMDDLSHNWGHPEEMMLKAALDDLVQPAATAAHPLKSAEIDQQKLFDYKGINQLINAY
jgi:carboxyl-terminal processing protease